MPPPITYNGTVGERTDSESARTGTLAVDSSPEAERLQVERWREMTPLEKARSVSALTRAVQELSLAGIRLRHPDASEDECLLRLAELKLGRRLMAQAYPDATRVLDT